MSNRAPASVRIDVMAGGVVVNAAGEFDAATLHLLDKALNTALGINPQVVLDLDRVTFVDARTLDCIAGAAQRAPHAGGQLSVRNPSAFIRRLFTITELTELLV